MSRMYLNYALHEVFLRYRVPTTNHLLQDAWQYKLEITLQ